MVEGPCNVVLDERLKRRWIICMRSSLEDGNRSSAGGHMGLDKKS